MNTKEKTEIVIYYVTAMLWQLSNVKQLCYILKQSREFRLPMRKEGNERCFI